MASHHRPTRTNGILRPALAAFLGMAALTACSSGAVDLAAAPEPPPDLPVDEQPMVAAGDPGMRPAYTLDPFEQHATHDIPDFGLSLQLPEAWTPLDLDTEWRIEGGSGFVHIRPADNDRGDLSTLCAEESRGSLQPYGSRPVVTEVTVAGGPACTIVPSGDQLSEGNWFGAVIVLYPEPLAFRGSTYRFAIISVDLAHLSSVAEGLAFA